MPVDEFSSSSYPEKMFGLEFPRLGTTWTEIDGIRHGAQADECGPIGGGEGYRDSQKSTGKVIRTLDDLIGRLQTAREGQVLYLAGDAVIDCTERVAVEELVLEVPGGVTIASNRGENGSAGALIFSDWYHTRPLIRTLGPEVRLSGLRIAGPNPKRCLEHHRLSFGSPPEHQGGKGSDYYYKFPVSDGVVTTHADLRVDNCELCGWSHAAIYLIEGDGHHIHHNFIHHNQYNGLGYGVSHDRARSLIERNCFDFNRHSIAGTGNAGSGYEACHNIELGTSLSHCFDMHGGRDRQDGTELAGSLLRIHHNTFGSQELALVVRGIPEEYTQIDHNWFYHDRAESALKLEGDVRLGDNAFGYRFE